MENTERALICETTVSAVRRDERPGVMAGKPAMAATGRQRRAWTRELMVLRLDRLISPRAHARRG